MVEPRSEALAAAEDFARAEPSAVSGGQIRALAWCIHWAMARSDYALLEKLGVVDELSEGKPRRTLRFGSYWRDNLLALLDAFPEANTGDWYDEIRHALDQHEGPGTPNHTAEEIRRRVVPAPVAAPPRRAPPTWPPTCDCCYEELTEPGALCFGPPDDARLTTKLHLCRPCWLRLLGSLTELSSKPADGEEERRP